MHLSMTLDLSTQSHIERTTCSVSLFVDFREKRLCLCVCARWRPHERTANETALVADCVTVPGEMELFIDMGCGNRSEGEIVKMLVIPDVIWASPCVTAFAQGKDDVWRARASEAVRLDSSDLELHFNVQPWSNAYWVWTHALIIINNVYESTSAQNKYVVPGIAYSLGHTRWLLWSAGNEQRLVVWMGVVQINYMTLYIQLKE